MKSFYATIDTNVLISAFIKPESNPGLIIKYIKLGYIIPLIHKNILKEYHDVLSRTKFDFDKKKIESIMLLFKEKGKYISPVTFEKLIDKDDEIFYAVTLEENKNHAAYLVTGNIKDYPFDWHVVTPREMLEIIYKSYTK